jgi:hypothetical protein
MNPVVLREAKARGIVLGGIDSTRSKEIDAFWLEWYGHPPEGKGGWGSQSHRLYAYCRSTSVKRRDGANGECPKQTRAALVGGIQWRKSSESNVLASLS